MSIEVVVVQFVFVYIMDVVEYLVCLVRYCFVDLVFKNGSDIFVEVYYGVGYRNCVQVINFLFYFQNFMVI